MAFSRVAARQPAIPFTAWSKRQKRHLHRDPRGKVVSETREDREQEWGFDPVYNQIV